MDRNRGGDSKATKPLPGKKTSMELKKDVPDPGFHRNVSEEDPPPSPGKLTPSDSKERLSGKGKSRTKSPSFFKMLVSRGISRKLSSQENGYSDGKRQIPGDTSSFSDNEDQISFSPVIPDHERQRISYMATLPRRDRKQRSSGERHLPRSMSDDNYCLPSPDSNTKPDSYESAKENRNVGEDQVDASLYCEVVQTPPTTRPAEYHSVGIEALEMLHNQLQILVIQDCDSDMADSMQDNVAESLKKQILELQESLAYLQKTDQNLRLSLKMAEMRAQEAETKLHYSSQRSLRLEDKCYRLEKECNSIHHNYCNLEKHLQKQAVLHQMQISPIKRVDRRLNNSAGTSRKQKSFDESHSPHMNSSVKRHNSSEFLTHHQRQKSLKKSMDHATADINPCNTLPTRLHSGSMSHTETRV